MCLHVCVHGYVSCASQCVHTPITVCVCVCVCVCLCVQSSGQGRLSHAQPEGLGWMANLRLAEVPVQLCTWRDGKEGVCFMGPSPRFPEVLHDPTRAAVELEQEGGHEFLPVKGHETVLS